MLRKLPTFAALAGAIAAGLGGWVLSASGGSPALVEGKARYAPIQAITYEFGSKLMTGYFVERAGMCVTTLMIMERGDPEQPSLLTPTRVRFALSPGQIAGLDSEEGRSLNFTCEPGGTAVLVEFGERERLVALQEAALQGSIAQRP